MFGSRRYGNSSTRTSCFDFTAGSFVNEKVSRYPGPILGWVLYLVVKLWEQPRRPRGGGPSAQCQSGDESHIATSGNQVFAVGLTEIRARPVRSRDGNALQHCSVARAKHIEPGGWNPGKYPGRPGTPGQER